LGFLVAEEREFKKTSRTKKTTNRTTPPMASFEKQHPRKLNGQFKKKSKKSTSPKRIRTPKRTSGRKKVRRSRK
jgi:hypothetical protein